MASRRGVLLDFGVADDKIKMTLKEGPEPNLETRISYRLDSGLF